MIKSIVREPLFHFLLLGAALFLFWFALGPEPELPVAAKPEIVITESRIDNLIDIWTKTRQRPPTQTELKGMIDDFLREEIFYRESLALGLDSDDVIIRRRMRQKMELFIEDMASAAKPTTEQLQQFLDSQAERFLVDVQVSFRHVYINPDRHEDDLETLIEKLQEELNKDSKTDEYGDPFLLPSVFRETAVTQLDLQFGRDFGQQVSRLDKGKWSTPLVSGYGLHLVFVDQKNEGRLPQLDEIRSEVEREWFAKVREEAKEEFFQKLKERYEIRIDLPEAVNQASGEKGEMEKDGNR